QEPEQLWAFVSALDAAERLLLLAHCVALTVNAVQTRSVNPSAESLAEALGLDMTRYWQPTTGNYFSRVNKERILEAVREGVSEQAARDIAGLKKQPMAEAADRLLAGKGWLPHPLRRRAPSAGEG